ncbi:hypothetical protein [Streptomyces sp. NPDC001415]
MPQHPPGHVTGKHHAVPSLLRRLLRHPSSAAHVVVHLRGDIGGSNARQVGALFDRGLRERPDTFEVDLVQVRHLGPDGTVPFFSALRACV